MDPEELFFNNVMAQGKVFKSGPSDLTKLPEGRTWNDEKFLAKYGSWGPKYWAKGRDVGKASNAANHLLACYFGVITDIKADEITTSWKLVNSCACINEEYVYPEGEAELTPTGMADPLSSPTTIAFSKTGGTGAASLVFGEISHTLASVNEWISDWKTKIRSEEKPTMTLAINMVSYMMDTLFRVCQKNCDDVSKHIMTRSRDTFNSVTTSDLQSYFPPPDINFSMKFSNIYAAQQQRSKERIAVLALLMLEHQTELRRGWLSATCMLSLSGTGLGLIQWFNKACQTLERDPESLAEVMMVDPLLRGLRRLYEWGDAMPSTEVSWMWARLLDQSVLVEYSVARNVKFCLVCALIVFDMDVESVREILQFKNKTSGIDGLVPVAKAIQNVVFGLGESCRAFGKAKETKNEMLKIKVSQPTTIPGPSRIDETLNL